ncbi:MAG: hypothetical protein ACMXYE_05055 [Candidatus Woesearchaeota archaeon]
MLEQFLTEYRIPIETVYTAVLVFCAFAVVYVTREIYLLSSHPGIKLFRHAFIFFGLAFLARYVLLIWMSFAGLNYTTITGSLLYLLFLMEFIFILAGIVFVVSITCRVKYPFLHNSVYVYAPLIALTIALVDVLFIPLLGMYITLFIVFAIGALLHFNDAQCTTGRVKKFHYFHAVVLTFALFGWVVNGLVQPFVLMAPLLLLLVYIVTASFFIVILVGINYAMCSTNVIKHIKSPSVGKKKRS